jgi:hypothetical protein
MVNRQLPPRRKTVQDCIRPGSAQPAEKNLGCRIFPNETDEFSQILGKQFFLESRFELSENLPLILLDYAQKPTDGANITFKASC